jgi:endoglucanase
VSRSRARRVLAVGTAALVSVMAVLLGGDPAGATIADGTQFSVAPPNHDAVRQIAELTSQGRTAKAALIRDIINTPTAVWVEGASAEEAEQQVRQTTRQAAGKKTVPVLVLYNIPSRDCAQYSAGGATSVAEYEVWIDGVVRGIGDREAVIALEPDSLGIIPWYTNIDGQLEWCQPAEADSATAASDRFAMLNYAVDALTALPNTSVYLDGTHSAWLNIGDISQRRLLPQRVELPVHRQPGAVRHVDLVLHHLGQPAGWRVRRLSEPVLGRWSKQQLGRRLAGRIQWCPEPVRPLD